MPHLEDRRDSVGQWIVRGRQMLRSPVLGRLMTSLWADQRQMARRFRMSLASPSIWNASGEGSASSYTRMMTNQVWHDDPRRVTFTLALCCCKDARG